jgi:hypothetical protein
VQHHNSDNSPGLLSRLRGTSEQELVRRVKVAEGLSDEAIEKHKRLIRHWRDEHWDGCRKKINSIFVFVAGVLILSAAIAIITLIVQYTRNTLANPAETKSLLSDLKDWVLVVFSTLFIEKKIRKE